MGAREMVDEKIAYETVAKDGAVLTKDAQDVHNVIRASGDEEY